MARASRFPLWGLVLLGLLWIPARSIQAQTSAGADATPSTADYNALRTPESPAFTILGIAPTSVARPTSPRGFALSFLTSLQSADDPLVDLSNFTVEANPYWWAPHPDVTFTEYRNQGMASLYRNLTVSLASTDSTLVEIPGMGGSAEIPALTFRRLGIGLKTTVHGQQTVPACVTELDALLAGVTDDVAERVAAAIIADPTLAADTERLEALRDELTEARGDLLEQIAARRGPCTQEASALTGFVMDIAAAAAFGHVQTAAAPPLRSAADGLSTVGAWLTPSFLGESFGAIGVVRVLWNDLAQDESTRSTDLGARGVYSTGRFAGSFEGVWRRNSVETGTETEYRTAVVFDVRLSEDVWFTSSFGKGFGQATPQGLTALANVQWAFGKPRPGGVPPVTE